jgi:hypothetical protein
MKNNSITLKKEERIARPLGVLIPLIRKDIKEMEAAGRKAAEIATVSFKIAIGEKLIEAKTQLNHKEWHRWLEHNFTLSRMSANLFIRMAGVEKSNVNRDLHLSQSEFIRRNLTPSHGRSAGWLPEMKERIDRVNVEQLTKPVADEEVEDKLERKLALDLIDIGYRALAAKLHPDKGGSKDGMSRLNTVRENLKACVNAW